MAYFEPHRKEFRKLDRQENVVEAGHEIVFDSPACNRRGRSLCSRTYTCAIYAVGQPSSSLFLNLAKS